MAALLPAPSPHDPAASSPVTSIDIDSLVASVSGTVIRPDDEAYDEARHVHNALIDRQPSLIVRAADAADVARTVIVRRATPASSSRSAAAATASPATARTTAASSSTWRR